MYIRIVNFQQADLSSGCVGLQVFRSPDLRSSGFQTQDLQVSRLKVFRYPDPRPSGIKTYDLQISRPKVFRYFNDIYYIM
jgi:hypothetical protein